MISMISSKPKVTVLMSVFNGEKYLNEAVDSILAQTFKDFEFLIIDDASTDRTPEILRSYGDPRIRIITNEENLGLTKSLNKGLALTRGEYIARMDADDISHPKRLERQVNYLDENPEIGILGTNVQYIDESGKPYKILRWPEKDALIKWSLCFFNPIAHPTVMVRLDLIKKIAGYDESIVYAQDYDLWVRLSSESVFGNLQYILLYLRKSDDNISHKNYLEQKNYSHQISGRAMSNILNREVPQKIVDSILDNEIKTNHNMQEIRYLLMELYRNSSKKNLLLSSKEQFTIRKDIAFRIIGIKSSQTVYIQTLINILFACYIYPFIPAQILASKFASKIPAKNLFQLEK